MKSRQPSLNIQGAFRHVLTDLYGFIGTAAAGIIILATSWTRADAIASLIVVGPVKGIPLSLPTIRVCRRACPARRAGHREYR